MALTGHLSDLSLSELIEFFCNHRKSGRLKVLYPEGAGYFYLHAGSVVDARIGVLHGIEAVFYALTLPVAEEVHRSFAPAFLGFGKESGGRRKPLFIGAIAVAVVASVAVIGVPAG